MLSNFDFSLLNSSDFKEDSVREDIICPLLEFLGYSTSGSEKITRSKNLDHPFVHIGTTKHSINIIPDYLLETSDGQKWILDAKNPREEIKKGKNVEQAFSYAIHPDVRASIYALCNGHELVIFNISKKNPILIVSSNKFGEKVDEIKKYLSPMAFTNPALLNFKPDFGLYMTKLSVSSDVKQYFYGIGLPSITKINDNLYSGFLNLKVNDTWYALSLDFDRKRYLQLLSIIPKDLSLSIKDALYAQPFKIDFDNKVPIVNLRARQTTLVIRNKDEDYCPLFVESFESCMDV